MVIIRHRHDGEIVKMRYEALTEEQRGRVIEKELGGGEIDSTKNV